MALSLLRGKVDREGFLKKCANAKGKDEVRGKWQQRWFVLKGYSLEYYKKKGDSTPKGIIDMRAAKVDDADDTTGMDFTIRIAQSKQVFTYLQCSHQQDRQDWLTALRKCAGYKVNEVRTSQMAPKSQKDAYASYGVLHAMSATATPVESVLVIDVDDKSIKLFDHGEIAKVYPHYQMTLVTPSKIASRPSHTDEPMYKVTLDMKAENYLSRKVLWVPTDKQADALGEVLSQVSQGNFSAVIAMQRSVPVRTGSVQMKDRESWHEAWVVLLNERVLIFSERDACVPQRVLELSDVKVEESSLTGLTLARTSGGVELRFVDTNERDGWARGFQVAATNMREQLMKDMNTAMKDDVSLNTKIPVHLRAPDDNAAATVERAKARWSLVEAAATLRDDEASFVVSWGKGSDGQLGHRTRDDVVRLEAVRALATKKVRTVAMGAHHAGAVTSQGHVFMWGRGDECQLGLGQNLKQSSSPYLLTSLRSKCVVRLALGRTHSLAVTVDGNVYSWGTSNHGQLGLGGQDSQFYPQHIVSLTHVLRIAAGHDHSACIVGEEHQVYVWGRNHCGQLGLGNTSTVSTPLPLSTLELPCGMVSCGGDSTGFLSDHGDLYMCGNNEFGQLGLGDTRQRDTPTKVDIDVMVGRQVVSVAVGAHNTMAVVEDGQPYCWGRGVYNGLQTDQPKPIPLRGLDGVKQCAVSETHSLLIDKSLHVFAFGQNQFGELGNGQPHLLGLTGITLARSLQVVQVACGDSSSMALIRGEVPAVLGSERKAEPVTTNEKESNEARMPLTEADLRMAGNITEDAANEKITTLLGALEVTKSEAPDAPTTANTDVVDVKSEKKKKKKKKGVWRTAVEESSGKTYYYNKKTRETRWIKPPEMEEEERLAAAGDEQ